MWSVYIIECKNKSLYTGITNNLERRLEEHRAGRGGKFTRAFKVQRIVFKEEVSGRCAALRREAEIKSLTRKNKIALIRKNKGSLC